LSDELTARRVRKTKDAGRGARFADLMPSFMLTLSERDLSAKTLEAYARTGAQFTRYLADNGLPDDTEGIDAPHIRAFLAAETGRTSAVSANQHYRNLRVLFKWLAREGERLGPDPMARVDPPKVTKKVKNVLTEAELTKLLRACEGTTFEHRRDTAIVRLLSCSGIERNAAMAAAVMGLERAKRDVASTPVERISAERVGHPSDLMAGEPLFRQVLKEEGLEGCDCPAASQAWCRSS
jgi:site-specific recombinase XerD